MPDTALPSGIVTFVLTDIVGSTQLWEVDRDAMARAIDRQLRIFDQLTALHGGSIVKSQGEGDSSFAVFSKPSAALAYARDVQLAMLAEQWPTPEPLRIRMGMHTGEAEPRGGDYVGRVVNRTARLRSLAHGGQTLATRATVDLTETLPDGVTFRALGLHRLRDLPRPEEVFQVCIEGALDDFPPLGSHVIEPNNLPLEMTGFIGREGELARVEEMLRSVRMVSIVGPGGAGKTRLALRAAHGALGENPGGVWLVELSPLRDEALIPGTTAAAIGARDEPGRAPLDAIADRIGDAQAIILLDNCEHLIRGAAPFASDVLKKIPGARILATSREPLDIAGETVFPVPPMALPPARPALEELERAESVRLFVERAAAAGARVVPSEKNAEALALICRRLDGNPLAIELAASRANVLSPEQIARRLDDRFTLLTTGARDVEPRQRTLAGAIDWSYDLLPDDARALFADLSVFAGRFSYDAAEAVASVPHDRLLAVLTSLVHRSLIAVESIEEPPRYRMLETVRAYAADRLRGSGGEARARDGLRDWCVSLIESVRPDAPATSEALDKIEDEYDNIRAAFAWTKESGDVESMARIAIPMLGYWSIRGGGTEGAAWLDDVIASLKEPSPTRMRALVAAGSLAFDRRELSLARSRLTEASELAAQLGDEQEESVILVLLGNIAHASGDYAASRDLYEQALERARAQGSPARIAPILANLGNLAHAQRDFASAERLYDEARQAYQQLGDPEGVAVALRSIGVVASSRRDYLHARDAFQRALDLAKEIRALGLVAVLTGDLGAVVHEEGDLDGAIALYEESLRLTDESSSAAVQVLMYLGEAKRALGDLLGARIALEEGLEHARAQGLKLSVAALQRQLGEVARSQGATGIALAHLSESLRLSQELGDPQSSAGAVESIACAVASDDPESAVLLIAAATAARASIGAPAPPSARPVLDAALADARSVLGDEGYDDAWARGASGSLDDAVARAEVVAKSAS